MPRNAATGRAYSGINVLILWGEAAARGYAGQGWLTFRQALDAGGAVRKWERGTCICYADRFTPESERARAEAEGTQPGSFPFLKRFTVFNTDQIDWGEAGPPPFAVDASPLAPGDIAPLGERLIAATGADFRVGGDRAFYSPARDFVQVPPRHAFPHRIDWYRTAIHELGHWTGHRARLARDQSGTFGSPAYAREELVAEMCAAFVLATLGIEPSVRHSDYIASWLDVLRADDRAIFRAASLAARAADHLLGYLDAPAAADAVRASGVAA
jgi:antirestriction protein ArdC